MSFAGVTLDQLLSVPVGIAAFVVLLTAIVFIHEYGHFSAARLLGVRVDVFSIGFGRAIARWTDRKGTEWRIAWIPFGGYVKFFGDENAASEPSRDRSADSAGADAPDAKGLGGTHFPRERDAPAQLTDEERAVCFHYKPVWRRAVIVAAGPVANFLLAISIFWGLLAFLGEAYWDSRVGDVSPDSAAAEAGLQSGDRILAINGAPVDRFDDIRSIVMLSAGDEIALAVDRDGERLDLRATPRRQESTDGFGNPVRIGILGIRPHPDSYGFKRYGAVEALAAAGERVWGIVATTVRFIGRLIFGKEDPRQLGGPLKIAQYAGQSALSGFDESAYESELSLAEKIKVSLATFINLAAVVSVSIGFLNLLPIPVLDGGHLMYYAYEAAAGKPLGPRAQAIGFRLGLILLASLMIFVTWNDVSALIVRYF